MDLQLYESGSHSVMESYCVHAPSSWKHSRNLSIKAYSFIAMEFAQLFNSGISLMWLLNLCLMLLFYPVELVPGLAKILTCLVQIRLN